jgi:exodeoxyribonuclease V beta subunit
VDYKTNWLGEDGQPLTAWHYRPAALDAEMQRRHYPLQALFYLLALHRYLRWRLPGYMPDRHLGGVLYLFVRGMVGPDTPVIDGQPCGVFSWAPPAELIVGLSDLFGTGGRHR